MLSYILIVLCLSLAGVAGLQMMYMLYLDRLDRERRKHLKDLETKCLKLSHRLSEAEARIAEQDELLADLYIDNNDEEVWADLIDER